MIVNAPVFIERVHIFGCQRGFYESMAAIDAGIE